MQFTPENCEQILAGNKTVTRRLVRVGDCGDVAGGVVWAVRRDGRPVWKVGGEYAVQPGRGMAAVGRIRMAEIRRERLWDIVPGDCIAEGLESDEGLSPFLRDVDLMERFEALWNGINKAPGTRHRDNPEVWVLRFEKVAT